MQNIIAIPKKTDTETRSVFVDRDVIELERLNAQTQKRIAKAEAERRKAEKTEAKFNAYTLHTIKYIAVRAGLVLATTWAGMADMIHPVIWSVITFYCLCTVCVKLGAWFARAVKQ